MTGRSLERRGGMMRALLATRVVVALIAWLASAAMGEPLPVPKPAEPGESCPYVEASET